MLYVLIVCNFFLSLFLLSAICYMCGYVKFLDKLFVRIPKILLVTIICYVVLNISLFVTDNMRVKHQLILVDAVVTDSRLTYEKIDYGEDELGFPDTELEERYLITYTFDYGGESHQVTKTLLKDKEIGTEESIAIDPNDPKDEYFSATDIPLLIMCISVLLVVFRIFAPRKD